MLMRNNQNIYVLNIINTNCIFFNTISGDTDLIKFASKSQLFNKSIKWEIRDYNLTPKSEVLKITHLIQQFRRDSRL